MERKFRSIVDFCVNKKANGFRKCFIEIGTTIGRLWLDVIPYVQWDICVDGLFIVAISYNPHQSLSWNVIWRQTDKSLEVVKESGNEKMTISLVLRHRCTIYALIWRDRVMTNFRCHLSYSSDFLQGNPVIFIESNIHAREWITSATATWLLNELLTSTDAVTQVLSNQYDWIIVPIVNVDGYVYTHTTVSNYRLNPQTSLNYCFNPRRKCY